MVDAGADGAAGVEQGVDHVQGLDLGACEHAGCEDRSSDLVPVQLEGALVEAVAGREVAGQAGPTSDRKALCVRRSPHVLPVVGVPVPLKHLDGLDSLLSIVQMPGGVPVATVAVGNGKNAGVLAAQIAAVGDPALRERLRAYKAGLADKVATMSAAVRREG